MTRTPSSNASRREFMKRSSILMAGGAMVANSLSIAQGAHAFGSDTIKIGLVGCGGRGTGAAIQAMNTSGGEVKLTALGDVFEDRLQTAYRTCNGQHTKKVDVPKERMFVGYDAYKQVLESDVDLVILATPPGFRPLHIEAAINAGKHVFAEKPVATDPAGVRRVLKACEEAKKKSLSISVGLQRRHERKYMATISEIQAGAIGDIILARAYWNGNRPWFKPRQEQWTELEFQMRNWYYFNWICGDHINEQHIHNLDVINWIKNGYPIKAQGMGGLINRNELKSGEIFDHHAVEYTYEDGSVMLSNCRHQPGCWNNVSEHVHGTKGTSDVSGSKIYDPSGKMINDFGKLGGDGHQQEHHDLFAELRAGNIAAEGEWGAKSTMTAILGRMATYSGQVVTWEKAINSDKVLANVDELTKLTDTAPVQPLPEGGYAMPTPGKTKVL